MTFCIHALNVAHVVALLIHVSRTGCCAGSNQSAGQQAGTGADRGTCSSGNGCTSCSSQSRADGCTLQTTRLCCLLSCRAAQLLYGVVTALVVIETELLEAFAGTRQSHDTRSTWQTDARCQ